MSNTYIWICILILFLVVYLTRLLPLLLCKGEIKNKFLSAMLSYLPYAVMASLIFPEVFFIDGMGLIPAITGFAVAVFFAYIGKGLVTVLSFATLASFAMMLILR